jgi:Cd2+/Zn2+-exporting ATPase
MIIAHDDSMEAVMVVMLFQVGQIIENIATNKSKAAIMSAVELRVESATKISDHGYHVVKPEDLKIGDKIIVRTGELIPIDGEIYEGEALIDTSSLTGEYVPVHSSVSNKVYGGCLVKSGTIRVIVDKKYQDSTVAKIMELIASGGEKKSKADQFIAKFAKWYTPIVVIVAALVTLIGGLIAQNEWLTFISVGLKIIVTGCPCAIVISVPLAYFSALGLASKNGIVVKGVNYLDSFVNIGKIVTDKTGTLTKGSFYITKVKSETNDDELLNSLLAAECLSTHPIGKAICENHDIKELASKQTDFIEIPGLGVKTNYDGDSIIAGSYKFLTQSGIDVPNVTENGLITYCGKNGQYLGYVVLNDIIKENAKTFVDLLHKNGIEILLLTGDKEENAKMICQSVGISNYRSSLLPEEKTQILEEEMKGYNKTVAYIGDGINDAPSIIRSDIGIAMGGIGSDIAVENADVVIMNDDPIKVYDTIKISKMARNTSIFNIVFALFVKISVAVLIAIFKDKIDMTVAVLADTGLTVVLVINSLLLLYRKIRRKK